MSTAPRTPADVNPAEHLGLVRRFIARNRWMLHGHSSFDEDDLLSEGFIALCAAKDKWDPARGAWSTAAMIEIHHHLSRYFENNSRTVRVPSWVHAAARQRGAPLPAQTESLQDTLGGGTVVERRGLSSASSPASQETMTDQKKLTDEVHKRLIRLDPETATVIRAHIGRDMTYRDAGKLLGRGREWARTRAVEAFRALADDEVLAEHAGGEVA